MKYETHAGLPTKPLLLERMIEHLRYLQEDCAMYAHLLNTESNHMDQLLARGWLGMSELFHRIEHQLITLAKGKLN